MWSYIQFSRRRIATCILAIIGALTTFARIGSAGEVQTIRSAACDIIFSGEIETGDADKLIAALEEVDRNSAPSPRRKTLGETYRMMFTPRLFLNSDGGNFKEAVRFAQAVIKHQDLTTVVKSKNQCYSACALIFLTGHLNHGDGTFELSRHLDVNSKLGFHMPYTAVEAPGNERLLNKAYQAGVRAVADLTDLSPTFYPRSLMTEFLRVERNDIYLINRIGQLAAWHIGLIGYRRPAFITENQIDNVCTNTYLSAHLEATLEPPMSNLLQEWEQAPRQYAQDTRVIDANEDITQRKQEHNEVYPGCSVFIRKMYGELVMHAEADDDSDGGGQTTAGGSITFGIHTWKDIQSLVDLDSFTPLYYMYPPEEMISYLR